MSKKIKRKSVHETLLDILIELEGIRCKLIDIETAAADDTYRSITAKDWKPPEPSSYLKEEGII